MSESSDANEFEPFADVSSLTENEPFSRHRTAVIFPDLDPAIVAVWIFVDILDIRQHLRRWTEKAATYFRPDTTLNWA
jgi:hypothetical protein